ncbi:putative xaa-pro dipeptidase app protein [Venturia nashicola]|nr:putative xaa-pro dipeptidase app protein [Venturia nashicola]
MTWPLRLARPLLRRAPSCPWPRLYHASPAFAHRLVSAAELQFGQPVHETHPHLLKPTEITPGITALEYAQRRWRLSDLLPKGSVAIVPGADIKYRSGAVFYEFHQDPDFFYLTGFNEPEALAVIDPDKRSSETIFHLFVRPKDAKAALWDGARSGEQAALDVFNADEAKDINKIEKLLPDILKGADKVYTELPKSFQHSTKYSRYLSGASPRPTEGLSKTLKDLNLLHAVESLRPMLNKLRVKKSDAEITNMRKAGQMSGRSITAAMGQSYDKEKDLWTFIDSLFKLNGCDGQAYVPVIAGGEHALSIHYVRNDDILKPEDMVLVDAGGEYGGYITDITRTWPNSGKFSSAQKDLYETILKVQRTCVSLCREDAKTTLDKIHKIAESGLKDGLKQLGFDMSGSALETLFPHHVGHYIGLDVHDSPGFPRTETLTEGHCITIEPGIYVPNDERWPAHFRGMGIRIEDSVCVQKESPLVFTTEAVKEVVDIEALRR